MHINFLYRKNTTTKYFYKIFNVRVNRNTNKLNRILFTCDIKIPLKLKYLVFFRLSIKIMVMVISMRERELSSDMYAADTEK